MQDTFSRSGYFDLPFLCSFVCRSPALSVFVYPSAAEQNMMQFRVSGTFRRRRLKNEISYALIQTCKCTRLNYLLH